MAEFFTFTGVGGSRHSIGDSNCTTCFDRIGYPCKCGGRIHSEFGDEHDNGDYYVLYCCEKCGEVSTDPLDFHKIWGR